MLDHSAHRKVMLEILKEIYSDTTIGPVLGFKGGTAAYLFYELERFSVDLDFNLLEGKKEDEVYEKITKILKNFGIIRDQWKKHHTLFWSLSCEEKSQNIKIEISRRNTDAKFQTKNYLGVPMLVMAKDDMFANKLTALLERKKIANRDVFDTWFFFKSHWPINTEILEKRTGMQEKKYLKKCIAYIQKNVSEKNILHGMGELLTAKQKSWAKAHLKADILFMIRNYLAAME